MTKYELTEEKIKINENKTLYRIKALRDFGDVKVGDLGGFVQSKNNLSQKGSCWIYDNAKISDFASIYDHAIINGTARICDSAIIFGDVVISDSAVISGSAIIFGSAEVF